LLGKNGFYEKVTLFHINQRLNAKEESLFKIVKSLLQDESLGNNKEGS
jgi:hypothetical protein